MDLQPRLMDLGIRPIMGERFLVMSEIEIAGLERQLKARLPISYRWFLSTYGAAGFDFMIAFRPVRPLPAYLSSDGEGVISIFYGPASDVYGRTYCLAAQIDTFADRMPESLIPIGDDGMGDEICLGIRGAEAGKIYYWDHERDENEDDYLAAGLPVPPNVRFRNVHLIADSFEDFIHRLYIDEEA